MIFATTSHTSIILAKKDLESERQGNVVPKTFQHLTILEKFGKVHDEPYVLIKGLTKEIIYSREKAND